MRIHFWSKKHKLTSNPSQYAEKSLFLAQYNKVDNMSKKYLSIVLLLFVGMNISAQTLEQLAREAFAAGQYEKAKPMLKRCLRTAPRDSRINYWYGASCIETGEVEEAYEYLRYAADRKVQNAYRYLGRYYYLTGGYDEAAEWIETYLSVADPNDSLYVQNQEFLQRIHAEARFFRRVEKVIFIDSVVVDKTSFLDAYLIGPESGSLRPTNSLRGIPSMDVNAIPSSCVAYCTEMANKIIFAAPGDSGRVTLHTSYKMTDDWSAPIELKGLPDSGDSNCPFMLSDGVTFYFANNGEGTVGGYDIFVTRYNSETGRFLKPDNVGMPFNSTANDYMMAIDELNGLGWFATDRRQPEGSVCIYTFVWNEGSKPYYDTDDLTPDAVRRAADIISIAESQTDEDAVRRARQSLFKLNLHDSNVLTGRTSTKDFVFVLDDFTDYHTLSDFRSPEAEKLYEQCLTYRNELTYINDELQKKRNQWASAAKGSRAALGDEIRQLEERQIKLAEDAASLERHARNEEINTISK